MADDRHFAIGGCPALDYPSTTRWHIPLEEDVHDPSLGAPYSPLRPAEFDCGAVAARVEAWLAETAANGGPLSSYAACEPGRYIIDSRGPQAEQSNDQGLHAYNDVVPTRYATL